MDSRKSQLQKQIVEALKANDNELYSLLKSQWAHRFGVESLEEFKNIELNQESQNLNYKEDQKNDQSQEKFFENNEEVSIKDDPNQDKAINKDNDKVIDQLLEDEKNQSYEIKSNETNDLGNFENNAINPVIDYKNPPKVKALIPIPPKPKYGYLKKWLLSSRF